jgi:hypothetical protein
MAAIAPISFPGTYKRIRNAAAQADTGQTDWIVVPGWAVFAEIDIDVNAVAGTTPILTPAIMAGNVNTLDDADAVQLNAAFTTPPTAASRNIIFVGPGVSAADDVALSANGNGQAFVNIPLPSLLGVRVTLDRADANETYTYTVSVKFRR